MTSSAPRQSPFDRWPVQHDDPRYGYAWYCGRGLIVSQTTVSHGSKEAAYAYHDYEGTILRLHAEEIAAAGGLFVIHDWRTLATYDTEARRVWQERMKSRKKGYLRGSVVCLTQAAPLLKMAVQAANLWASVLHGAKVELTSDIRAALLAHNAFPEGVRP